MDGTAQPERQRTLGGVERPHRSGSSRNPGPAVSREHGHRGQGGGSTASVVPPPPGPVAPPAGACSGRAPESRRALPAPDAEARRPSGAPADPARADLVGSRTTPTSAATSTPGRCRVLAAAPSACVFPDVANLPLRHPAVLAKSAATLDRAQRRAGRARAGRRRVLGGIRRWAGALSPGSRSTRSSEAIGIFALGRRAAVVEGEHYRSRCSRAAAGARHRHLARRLQAADAAPHRRARRRLDPVACHGSARQVPTMAPSTRRRRPGPRPAVDPSRLQPQRRDRRRDFRTGCAARPSTGSRSS